MSLHALAGAGRWAAGVEESSGVNSSWATQEQDLIQSQIHGDLKEDCMRILLWGCLEFLSLGFLVIQEPHTVQNILLPRCSFLVLDLHSFSMW